MSFRKENKYRLKLSELHDFKKKLLNNGMTKLHNLRRINSCYFDTEDLKCYLESEEGVLPRKKIRVRWYNNEKKFIKETKISSFEGRFKIKDELNDYYTLSDIKKIKFFDNNYGLVKPILLVSYLREYYSFQKLRITFDYDISYSDLNSLKKLKFLEPDNVLEIKASENISLDYIQQFVNHSTSRFSKYSRGVLALKRLL